MNLDLLLGWMSHLVRGSWASFKRAVQELAPPESDVAEIARRTRVTMSDLGCADFFIDGSGNWRVLPPKLGGLCRDGAFMLVGARSAEVISAVQSATSGLNGDVDILASDERPSIVVVRCGIETAKQIAEIANVGWSSSLARDCLAKFIPIPALLESLPAETPLNWSVRSFDLQSLQWVETLLPKSACEFSSRFGDRRFFVHLNKGKFIAAGKRESVFASAFLQNARLVEFDSDASRLSVSSATPLPERLARAACLCSGKPADVIEKRFSYSEVSHGVAHALLAAIGQRVPSTF